jgi:hypothetical protein
MRKGYLKGNIPWNKGLETGPLSKEARELMSKNRRGIPAWNKGLKFKGKVGWDNLIK